MHHPHSSTRPRCRTDCRSAAVRSSIALRAMLRTTFPALFEQAPRQFQAGHRRRSCRRPRRLCEARMKDVERFVRPSSENGKRWLTLPALGRIEASARAPKARRISARLATTYQRLNRDENGLELPAVSPPGRCAAALHAIARRSRSRPIRHNTIGSQLERLKTQLDEYRSEPTDATAVEIGGRIAFLAGLDRRPNWWPPCGASSSSRMRSWRSRPRSSPTAPNRSIAASRSPTASSARTFAAMRTPPAPSASPRFRPMTRQ